MKLKELTKRFPHRKLIVFKSVVKGAGNLVKGFFYCSGASKAILDHLIKGSLKKNGIFTVRLL